MQGRIEIIPIGTRLITEEDNLAAVFLDSLSRIRLSLEDGDTVVVASKVVSLTEKRYRRISDVRVSEKARRMGKKLAVEPALMQLILDESDSVLEGPPGYVLAVRNGFPCVNACIDAANSPNGFLVLPPADSDQSARRLREAIGLKTSRNIAVIVADSGLLPGRRGTIGVALGFAGLRPAKNYIGKKDLYGRQFKVTHQSVVDDISSAAKLLMGEADERIPFVVVRGAPIELTDEQIGIESTLLPSDMCVFMSNIKIGDAH